jgi:hypothetical protein
METLKEKPKVSAHSWTHAAEHKCSLEASFYPELRRWVQNAIMEAEKRGNFERKDQLLALLRDL